MKVKTSELSGEALDWAVAAIEGWTFSGGRLYKDPVSIRLKSFSPSTDWAQGGPIIERERITLERFKDTSYWSAFNFKTGDCEIRCTSPLVAAMRCFVASKLGDVVDVPEDLIGG